jgi:hypothetical protein
VTGGHLQGFKGAKNSKKPPKIVSKLVLQGLSGYVYRKISDIKQ